MKRCAACGHETPNDVPSCEKCGTPPAAETDTASPPPADPYATFISRPTGGGFILWAIIFFVLAVIAALGWALLPTETYGTPDPAKLVLKANVLGLSSGLFSLGVVMLGIGYILRALWFLPGEDRKPG